MTIPEVQSLCARRSLGSAAGLSGSLCTSSSRASTGYDAAFQPQSKMPLSGRAQRPMATAGFTLVELLVVAIVLAIFAAVIVPVFGSSANDVKEAAVRADLSRIRQAIDLYREQHRGVAPGVVMSASNTCPAPGTSGLGGPGTDLAFIYQLSLFTDINGGSCSATSSTFRFGPYLRAAELPKNPYTNNNQIRVVARGELQPIGASAESRGGWLYDRVSVRFVLDHEDYDHL